jgi:hypothetical protein
VKGARLLRCVWKEYKLRELTLLGFFDAVDFLSLRVPQFTNMSEVKAEFVYQGLWVNQNYNRVVGTVITTTTRTGTIITALLAVLSAIGL